ncbi:uncharacterized protein LOC122552524 [Chiloscyllium plagiosum]|uniref:uncharacterized protein LOC122552524 n=1 Tax=Chiloscyllium plagiosum TaxID=36176 RepID=UPI001CB7AD77|nr:uncharacterized protein LOC122552524 [Chiloscyllium plagiosum]
MRAATVAVGERDKQQEGYRPVHTDTGCVVLCGCKRRSRGDCFARKRRSRGALFRGQKEVTWGLSGFCQKLVPNLGSIVTPLTDLLKKNAKCQWTESCQEVFDHLKLILTTKPVLATTNFSKPFKVVVVASDVGVGAVLLQEDEVRIELPVGYFTKKINIHQRKYSKIEKERLSLGKCYEDVGVPLKELKAAELLDIGASVLKKINQTLLMGQSCHPQYQEIVRTANAGEQSQRVWCWKSTGSQAEEQESRHFKHELLIRNLSESVSHRTEALQPRPEVDPWYQLSEPPVYSLCGKDISLWQGDPNCTQPCLSCLTNIPVSPS